MTDFPFSCDDVKFRFWGIHVVNKSSKPIVRNPWFGSIFRLLPFMSARHLQMDASPPVASVEAVDTS